MNAKNKTILMIRERKQAADFITKLDLQSPVVFAPMVRIVPLHTDQTWPKASEIIFTSPNAVRLYAKTTKNRNAQVFCVGSQTERMAQDNGFGIARRFETAAELVAHFNNMPKTNNGILYPRAETISLDITNELSKAGHQIQDAIIYRQTFQSLPGKARNLIESSGLIVPIFSQEIAKRFRELLNCVKPHDLTLICISANVADIFANFSGFRVEITQKPTRAAMIDSIKANLMAQKI